MKVTAFMTISHWGIFEVELDLSIETILNMSVLKDGYIYTPINEDLFGVFI